MLTVLMAKQKPTTWTAKRVAKLREALKSRLEWDQEKCAGQIGVTSRLWRHWEAGTRTPSGPAVFALQFLNDQLPEEFRV